MKDQSFRTRKQPLCEQEGGQLVRLRHGKQTSGSRSGKRLKVHTHSQHPRESDNCPDSQGPQKSRHQEYVIACNEGIRRQDRHLTLATEERIGLR